MVYMKKLELFLELECSFQQELESLVLIFVMSKHVLVFVLKTEFMTLMEIIYEILLVELCCSYCGLCLWLLVASMNGNYFIEATISFDFSNGLFVIGSGLHPSVHLSCMILGSKYGSRRMEGICEHSTARMKLRLVVVGHGREVWDLGKLSRATIWILMMTSLTFRLPFPLRDWSCFYNVFLRVCGFIDCWGCIIFAWFLIVLIVVNNYALFLDLIL